MFNEYQMLWKSILIRLILDSLNFVLPVENQQSEIINKQAKYWLKSKSFYHVCDLADQSPQYILKLHAKIIKKKSINQDQVAQFLRSVIKIRN